MPQFNLDIGQGYNKQEMNDKLNILQASLHSLGLAVFVWKQDMVRVEIL